MTPTCPTCGQPVDPASRNLPFCSERCQWVDLGKWLSEEYVVPGAPADGDPSDDDVARTEDP